jgi:hypothetical protein
MLFPTPGRVYVWRTLEKAYNLQMHAWFQQPHEGGSAMVWAAISWYSILLVPLLLFIAKLLQRRTWTLGNQAHPMIHKFSNDAVFQKNNAPIHTVATVQPWFEDHEGKLQHLPWPEKSPDLIITEPLWSVLETRLKSRFPLPTSLKKLEDEWYIIPLKTVQNWYISRRINKEMHTLSAVFPLFCPAPVWIPRPHGYINFL